MIFVVLLFLIAACVFKTFLNGQFDLSIVSAIALIANISLLVMQVRIHELRTFKKESEKINKEHAEQIQALKDKTQELEEQNQALKMKTQELEEQIIYNL